MFYSSLKNTSVSKSDHQHAKNVYKLFKCKTLLQFNDLYCLSDTAALAEIMWSFRETVFKHFSLEMLSYISTPQLCYDAFLRTTKVELELLTDIDKIQVRNNMTL